MNKKTNDKSVSTSTILAIGAGVAAIATTSYYLFGPEGKDHRDKVKGWMIKMKGEIIERIEDVKELTEPLYHEIVDSVVASYMATSKISKDEVKAYADKLKGQWKDIVAASKNATEKSTPKKKLGNRVLHRTNKPAKRKSR